MPDEKSYDWFPGAPMPNPVARRAHVRQGQRRPVLEGHQSAAGCRLRSVRQRPDRAQGRTSAATSPRPTSMSRSCNNPITTSVNTASRSWTDANSNYVPDCDLGNFGHNGECGAIDNQNFGKNNPSAVRWSDDVRQGWGTRDYNWEIRIGSAARAHPRALVERRLLLQHRRLLPQHRQRAAREQQPGRGAQDFDSFCVTAPTRSAAARRRRLPRSAVCPTSSQRSSVNPRCWSNPIRHSA